jgi:hypothetical protein
VQIVIEQEPGAAGKATADHYRTRILPRYHVKTERPTGDKATRAWPAAAAAENGLTHLVRGRHTLAFLDDLTAFPHSKHDDCVDALSAAHTILAKTGRGFSISSPSKHHIHLPTPAGSYADRRNDPHLEHLASRIGASVWSPPPPGLETR